ncbi:hypothetical protein HK100_003088 [Physocladia obscura]|uniref:Uncharacterized protein n=1 Tax=Physocladia obscura TaxID=109957 RepID=A0AAD5T7U3_9FUNG|nr:hypothetical protein HK100_003088 [Physocladia obscura]
MDTLFGTQTQEGRGHGLVLVLAARTVRFVGRVAVPVALGAAGIGLLMLAVPVALAVAPAVALAASPAVALVAAALLLLAAFRARLGDPASSRTARLFDRLASLFAPATTTTTANRTTTIPLAARTAFTPVPSSNSRYVRLRDFAASWLPFTSTSASSSNNKLLEEGLIPPASSSLNSFAPPHAGSNVNQSFVDLSQSKVVFKALNPATDAPLLALCSNLLKQNPTTFQSMPASSNPQQQLQQSTKLPLVRLGRSDPNGLEYKVLSVWRKDAKQLLIRRDFSSLQLEHLVAFAEYMHPIDSPGTIRIEKLVTNPPYYQPPQQQRPLSAGSQPSPLSFSHRLITEIQRLPNVQSIGVWCLTGVEPFYEALGFVQAKNGEKGPWMVWIAGK